MASSSNIGIITHERAVPVTHKTTPVSRHLTVKRGSKDLSVHATFKWSYSLIPKIQRTLTDVNWMHWWTTFRKACSWTVIIQSVGADSNCPYCQPIFTTRRRSKEPGSRSRSYETSDLVRYQDDGNLRFMGHKDTQVKIRGQSVRVSKVKHKDQ